MLATEQRKKPLKPSKTGGKPGEELYAIAVEIFDRHGQLIDGKVKYLHALDAQNARVKFRHAYPNTFTHRIVAIALPIGYFVEDKKGEILSVS